MKQKHQGLVSVLICLAAAASAVLYFLFGSWEQQQPTKGPRLPAMASITVPAQETLKEMSRLERKMGRLAQPPSANSDPVRLELFGYSPDTLRMAAGRQGKTDPAGPMDHVLTLAFDTKQKKICRIGGDFFREGATLSDGAVVVSIESRRVLLEKDKVRKWIYIAASTKGEAENDEELR